MKLIRWYYIFRLHLFTLVFTLRWTSHSRNMIDFLHIETPKSHQICTIIGFFCTIRFYWWVYLMVKIHRATQVHCGMLYCTQSLKLMISIMWGQVSFDQASFFMPEFYCGSDLGVHSKQYLRIFHLFFLKKNIFFKELFKISFLLFCRKHGLKVGWCIELLKID